MPIPILTLPFEIRDYFTKKMNLRDFVNYHKTARQSFKEAAEIRATFPIYQKQSPNPYGISFVKPSLVSLAFFEKRLGVRIHCSGRVSRCSQKPYFMNFCSLPLRLERCEAHIQTTFTEGFCRSLIRFLYTTCSQIDSISFVWCITCSPESLEELVKTEKVKELRFLRPISPEYGNIETINKISHFIPNHLEKIDSVFLNNFESEIECPDFTSASANKILKDLLSGRRRIRRCVIRTNEHLEPNDVLKDIPFNTRCYKTRRIVFIGENPKYEVETAPDSIVIKEVNPAEEKRCVKRSTSTNSNGNSAKCFKK